MLTVRGVNVQFHREAELVPYSRADTEADQTVAFLEIRSHEKADSCRLLGAGFSRQARATMDHPMSTALQDRLVSRTDRHFQIGAGHELEDAGWSLGAAQHRACGHVGDATEGRGLSEVRISSIEEAIRQVDTRLLGCPVQSWVSGSSSVAQGGLPSLAEEYAKQFPKKKRRTRESIFTMIGGALAIAYILLMVLLMVLFRVDIREYVGPLELWPGLVLVLSGVLAGFLTDYFQRAKLPRRPLRVLDSQLPVVSARPGRRTTCARRRLQPPP